jgi:hypothetical protein
MIHERERERERERSGFREFLTFREGEFTPLENLSPNLFWYESSLSLTNGDAIRICQEIYVSKGVS